MRQYLIASCVPLLACVFPQAVAQGYSAPNTPALAKQSAVEPPIFTIDPFYEGADFITGKVAWDGKPVGQSHVELTIRGLKKSVPTDVGGNYKLGVSDLRPVLAVGDEVIANFTTKTGEDITQTAWVLKAAHHCQLSPLTKPASPPQEQRTVEFLVTPSAAPPTNPADIADSSLSTQGFTVSTATLDSFKKEVSAKITYTLISVCDPPAWGDKVTPFKNVFSSRYSRYILNTGINYDDQWKDGAPAVSTVTQSYSALLVNLSNLAYIFPTSVLASEYHNNQQGVFLEQEYGAGLYYRKLWGTIKNPTDPTTTKSKQSLLVSLSIRESFDKLAKQTDSSTTGPGLYILVSADVTKKNTLGGSFKGYAPFGSPLVNGRASSDIKDTYKLSAKWGITAEISDTYFATVPATYRPNSLSTSFGIKYNPSGSSN